MFKSGDKVTRIWNDNVDVKQGKIYTIKKREQWGVSLEETGNALYSSQGFKLVEDDMKIKITKWEDLDGKENDYVKLSFAWEKIFVHDNLSEDTLDVILYKKLNDNTIMKLLSAFDFQIEFAEPIKLTKADYHMAQALYAMYPDGWVARDKDTDYAAIYYGYKPKTKNCNEWEDTSRLGFDSILKEFFPFITFADEQPYSTKELAEMEME